MYVCMYVGYVCMYGVHPFAIACMRAKPIIMQVRLLDRVPLVLQSIICQDVNGPLACSCALLEELRVLGRLDLEADALPEAMHVCMIFACTASTSAHQQ